MCTFGPFSCIRKGTRRAGADTPHPGAACGTLLKKGKVLHRCTSPTIVWGHPRVQVSLEHERLSGGAGFFKGRRPLNALLVPFRAFEKGPAARGRTPRIPVPLAAHFSKKVRCCTAAQKEPQRGGGLHGSIRLAPDQTDRRSRLPRVFSGLRPEARHTPRRPCGLPHGLGVSDPSPCAPPWQAGKLGSIGHCVMGSRQRKFGFPTKLPGRKRPTSGDFSDLRSEARLRPRRPCGLPHGLGVSDPSPCAPPRQAGKLGPFEHSVEGFCGAARVEWARPAWAKNRSRRAVTCVSLPPSQRRAPFRGFHKGDTPLCALLVPFRASEKGPAARGRTPRIPVPLAAHFSKKVRYSTAVHLPPSSGGIRGCKSALSMSVCLGARGSLRGVAP